MQIVNNREGLVDNKRFSGRHARLSWTCRIAGALTIVFMVLIQGEAGYSSRGLSVDRIWIGQPVSDLLKAYPGAREYGPGRIVCNSSLHAKLEGNHVQGIILVDRSYVVQGVRVGDSGVHIRRTLGKPDESRKFPVVGLGNEAYYLLQIYRHKGLFITVQPAKSSERVVEIEVRAPRSD